MRRLFLCLLLIGLPAAAQAQPSCPDVPIDEWVQVRYVHDGDTLHLADGRKLRLIGINAPERERDEKPAQPLALQARTALQQAISNSGHKIGLVLGRQQRDRYQRTLAHAFSSDGANLQVELLEQGLAAAITFPPNTVFSQCYAEAENSARCQGHGIWSQPVHRPLPADQLGAQHTGFRIINGTVEHVSETGKGIWLFMSELMIGIRTENLAEFDTSQLLALKGKRIEVRGWVNLKKNNANKRYRNGINVKYYMRIRHPASLELNPGDRAC